MELILAAGADSLSEHAPIWEGHDPQIFTYLARATSMRRKDMVELLLHSGADVHHPAHTVTKGNSL